MQPQDDIRPGLLRRRVIVVALAVLIADLATKQVMLGWVFDPPQRVEILPFLNFVPVWNPGISFGMLSDGGMLGVIALPDDELVSTIRDCLPSNGFIMTVKTAVPGADCFAA